MTRDSALQLLRTALSAPTADFHEGQWEAIAALDHVPARVLLVQRTGWGKSIVYFLATKLRRDQGFGPTLVISPLLSLIRNQLAAASGLGLRAESVNSENRGEWDRVREGLVKNEIDLLVIAPERLANEQFRDKFLSGVLSRIGLLVVDEAHCISDWGHDFRPDYRRIGGIVRTLPKTVALLATTATANDRVVADIVEQFGPETSVMRGPLRRETLWLQPFIMPDPAARLAWLADNVPRFPGSGIIYTLTIHDAEMVSRWLRKNGIDAPAYHSEINSENPVARVELEQRLLSGNLKALVATSALGMGFDKPDIGFIIHYQKPGSVVHYYQQIGRAGRAVERALCVLFSGIEDNEILDYFIESSIPKPELVEEVINALDHASAGLTHTELLAKINCNVGDLEKVLKNISVAEPPPIILRDAHWMRTLAPYLPDTATAERLKKLRLKERRQMEDYLTGTEGLMRFLTNALDDKESAPCGKCSVCRGGKVVTDKYKPETFKAAQIFMRQLEIPLLPRKRLTVSAAAAMGLEKTSMPNELRLSPGRVLCRWGDPSLGELIRVGKYTNGRFDDRLIAETVEMIRERWHPDPAPEWGCAVPSLRTPGLVPDFAERLCKALEIPYIRCLKKIKETRQQKTMQNSVHQAANLLGAFQVDEIPSLRGKPVLLIDDLVDSGWTLTIAGMLLLKQGSGPVYPFALARTTKNQ